MKKCFSFLFFASLLFGFPLLLACGQEKKDFKSVAETEDTLKEHELLLGNRQFDQYLHLLEGKKIAFVGNHTSVIRGVHLVDSLLNLGFELVKVFSPEHGFRGLADAGEKVKDGIDFKTNLPVFSLYGKNKKPTHEQLKNVDILLFDLQDVGARFYTYISTLHYVMEAAAEHDIPLVVLDRPNPNGHYVDGPILEKKYQSFVGMHPVPIVHGMSICEYARMINGEGWLEKGIRCDLEVVKCLNYQRENPYQIEIPPSPNLPNSAAVFLYPSLCLFEGTAISVGRGTKKPFQQVGAPNLKGFEHTFTPQAMFGAKSPKYKGKICYGLLFSAEDAEEIRKNGQLKLSVLLKLYAAYPEKEQFFTSFFKLLAGTESLQNEIVAGKTESEIRSGWEKGIADFKAMRKKYLLYP